MQDDWADALEHCYDTLSVHLKKNKDSGDTVKASFVDLLPSSDLTFAQEINMPEILQFLVSVLSCCLLANIGTIDYSWRYLTRLTHPPKILQNTTWRS